MYKCSANGVALCVSCFKEVRYLVNLTSYTAHIISLVSLWKLQIHDFQQIECIRIVHRLC